MIMSEATQRVVESLLMPPATLFLLMFIGLLFYRRLLGKLFAWLGLLGLYLMSIPISSTWLGHWVETVPPTSAQQLLKDGAQAILVLTAGARLHNPELNGAPRVGPQGMQRLSYAVRLNRETGLPIIISGGKIQTGQPYLADLYADWLRLHAKIEPLALEKRSANTWQNLEYSAPILRAHHIQRVALVTNAFHMQRALYAAHAFGVDAIPAPFGYIAKSVPADQAQPLWKEWLPTTRSLRENHFLLRELVGNLWYRLFHHANAADSAQPAITSTSPH